MQTPYYITGRNIDIILQIYDIVTATVHDIIFIFTSNILNNAVRVFAFIIAVSAEVYALHVRKTFLKDHHHFRNANCSIFRGMTSILE